jgi:hypothetical protein
VTDLPQLQQALVLAARRRNRLARARSALIGLAAVAAVMVAASTALDGRERELEVSATPRPVLTAREAADRFAVLRDESRLTKRRSGFDAGPGSQTYRIPLGQENLSYYVTVGERLCTAVASSTGFGGGCLDSEELKDFAEGRLGVETAPLGPVGVLIFALVPDGTRDATITADDDAITESLPIKDNLLGVALESRSVSLSWTTPDGERFTAHP